MKTIITKTVIEQRDWYDTNDIMRLTGSPKITVAGWRKQGIGPPFYLIGKSVRYPKDEVDAWLEARKKGEWET